MTLRPGDLIGRMPGAALHISNPRISEAHALVTLRGPRLMLQALRGPMSFEGIHVLEVVMRPGVRVQLCDGVELTIESVALPESVLGVAGLSADVLPLTASVHSVLLDGPPRLVARFDPEAAAWLWTSETGWTIQIGRQPPRPFEVDRRYAIGQTEIRGARIPLVVASSRCTRGTGRPHPTLRVVARHDAVHIFAEGRPVTTLSGLPGRILSELVTIGLPVSWEVIARSLWSDADPSALRTRWDRNLHLLRSKLRAARLRSDLVRSDGTGLVEVVLVPGDVTVDET
ncbi:MAG: hypothetical protein KTR31_28305 [Myxococcales bacterium]|nr:hypothetical protein [Myxococcales bacterium]